MLRRRRRVVTRGRGSVAFDVAGVSEAEALLHEADAAAYAAKSAGKGRAQLYDDSMRDEASERAEVEDILRQAIADDELVLEASFYGWCLEKPVVADQPELEKVSASHTRSSDPHAPVLDTKDLLGVVRWEIVLIKN